MRIIIDSNILFSALIRNSATRAILTHFNAEFCTITFSDTEIEKYKHEIIEKSKMSEEQINTLLNKLKEKLTIISDERITLKIPEALEIMKEIDIKDTPFIAAALAIDAAIWSEDKHFEQQTTIKIYKTKDLINLLNS